MQSLVATMSANARITLVRMYSAGTNIQHLDMLDFISSTKEAINLSLQNPFNPILSNLEKKTSVLC